MTALASASEVDSLLAQELASTAFTVARRFADGATMWCVAPRWPAHGAHVAVEFVHPVIVGKRALPAVHLTDNTTDALRTLTRSGDLLLAIGPSEDRVVTDLLWRAEAWGLTRIWLGAGPRPPDRRVESVAWAADIDPDIAARSGKLVLLYHLLWELTHVVFEHPGLLEPASECRDEVCITCADEGRLAEVQRILDDGSADVIVAGRFESVDISLVHPVNRGDVVLVHAGVALARLGDDIGPGIGQGIGARTGQAQVP